MTLRVGIGIVVLTLLSVGLLAATVWLFIGLQDSRQAVAGSIREDAVWAAFQTDREAARLVEAILTAETTGSFKEIQMRFDLLYSRLGVIKSGKFGIAFGEQSGVGETAAAVVSLVLGLEPEIDRLGLLTDDGARQDLLTTMLGEARAIRSQTGKLIVAANAAVNELRVTERDASLNTYVVIGAAVGGLTLVLVLIVGLLGVQLRQISRTGREVMELSEKHARSAHAAEAANRAKSAFLATMSHEIRTPLNAIIGMADVLKQTGLNHDQAQQLGIIRSAGDVLLDVINDILDYSKLEAGAVTIERKSASLPEIIGSVRAIMATRATAASLDFEMTAPAMAVSVDAARLRQVLLNLVGNAIKFTRHGSVTVGATLSNDVLRIEVADTGPGIPEDQFGRLFRDFSQLDSSSTRAFGGTGLGLAICRRLAEAMGGSIGVTSKVGFGSTFWVEIPAGPVARLPEVPATISPIARALAPSGASGVVLVVDDNEINRQVAAALLRGLGWRVETADDGAKAADRLATGHFDLVLMDMQMPVLDGIAATRIIRDRGDRTPIVGLTANAFEADRVACLAAGMNDHLAKPVTRDKLAGLLADLLMGAAAPAHASLSRFGVNALQQDVLRHELGEGQYDMLVEAFIADGVRMIDEAGDALNQQDLKRYDRLMHTLKGAALTLGFSGIGEEASRLRAATGAAADLAIVRAAVAELGAA